MRVFEKKTYSSLDFQTPRCKTWKITSKQQVVEKLISNKPVNALYEELLSFMLCINSNKRVIVDVDDGINALDIAIKIQKIIEKTK